MGSATDNLVLSTETEAVNAMLGAVGEAPIADVTTTTLLQAINAGRVLRRVSRQVQTEAWEFNTEWDVELAVNGDNKIPIGGEILRVDATGVDAARRLVRRGAFMRDMDDHTDLFTSSIRVKTVTFLSFEDIPQSARDYISIKAAREFQGTDIAARDGDLGFTADSEARARLILQEEEGDAGNYNILTNTLDRYRIISRTGMGAGAPGSPLFDFIHNS